MEWQEAICYLRNIEAKYIHGGDEEFDDKRKRALHMGNCAIQYRIPMKPVGDLHSVPHYRCPSCNGAIVMYEDSPEYPYCQWCGQALLWEST